MVALSVLIIGGAGFIGRNLSLSLEREGADVSVFDRASDRFLPRFRNIVGDARDQESLSSALLETRPDVVYHLAANSDIASGVLNPSADFDDTLMTTVALHQALMKNPAPQVVFASSSAIFGECLEPLSEAMADSARPISWYGKAKLAGEIVMQSSRLIDEGIQVFIVRFPNVVGPFATHGVIWDFVNKLRQDSSRLKILGDGNQSKPYLHVRDLIEAMEFIRCTNHAPSAGINVGPSDQLTVRQIADEVCKVLSVAPQLEFDETPYGWPGDIPRYQFDTTKMRSLGFEVERSSADAVRLAARQIAEEDVRS